MNIPANTEAGFGAISVRRYNIGKESNAMTVQTFREMFGRRPFQPVKVTLSSGLVFEIRHPEMAMLTRTSLLLGVDVAPDGVPAEFKILSLLHVASMEPLSNQAA
jgi:hypothetical protein